LDVMSLSLVEGTLRHKQQLEQGMSSERFPFLEKGGHLRPSTVNQTCNHSYLVGRDRRIKVQGWSKQKKVIKTLYQRISQVWWCKTVILAIRRHR
jgi:hypothetical protein